MEIKYCKDCEYYIAEKVVSETPRIIVQYACICPEIIQTKNPVTGEIKKSDYVDAMTARVKGYCTLDAKCFKLKLTTSQSLNVVN